MKLVYDTKYNTLPASMVAGFLKQLEDGKEPEIKSVISFLGKDAKRKIQTFANNLEKSILNLDTVKYLHINAPEQRFFYNANNHDDKFAQLVKKYDEGMGSLGWDDVYEEFVGSWLKHFDLEDKYIITQAVGDGAYKVYLSKNKPEFDKETQSYLNQAQWRPLATYGTGIIRIVSLIMNLANLFFDFNQESENNNIKSKIIIIEEPEMNLHPKLQSRLADLFCELNLRYGFIFIIETHSEYIIRKTQVAVKNAQYRTTEELDALNPYKVIYFPQNDDAAPYEMIYRTDGRFRNKFGEGFYDEANNLIWGII